MSKLFEGSSSLNNAPMPRGAGWAVFGLPFVLVIGGTALIQHVFHSGHIATILTVVLWLVAIGGFTFLSFRRTSLPSRGE